jgi:SAM-dependent methyltransferase
MQLNARLLLDRLEHLRCLDSLEALRQAVGRLQDQIENRDTALFSSDGSQEIEIDLTLLSDELAQIAASRSLTRARYYVRRLVRGLTEVRTNASNDINLNRWKAYPHVLTDSLWIVERRDSSGAHNADYWGNFIPQIPRQMMLRYSKRGEWVLDPFVGGGTSAIEAQRLGRNLIGVELQANVAEQARQVVAEEANPHGATIEITTGDSLTVDFPALLQRHNQRTVQLAILHPPYFDIIKFSDDVRDLSNAASTQHFLDRLGHVVARVAAVLDPERYLILVIGDKYSQGEWIPLGFMAMDTVMGCGFRLKSIVVKNLKETTGKRRQGELWRYRALAGGFYVFKHEYIFIFQKRVAAAG